MSARDDFGSNAGRPGGYGGGAGGLGNGGVGGGTGGGFGGGGAGRNGGIGSRTGLTTGNMMYGGMAMGRPGGMAMNPGAWGQRPQAPVQQGPMGQPPGLLGNPVPASIPGVNPIMSMANYMPDFMNPIEGPNFFNTYKAPPAPEPTTPFGPRQNYWGGWPSMVSNNNPYNDPRFGMPSGIQANGLAQAGIGSGYGGPNGMRQW